MTTTVDLGSYHGARNAYLDEFGLGERWEELMARTDDRIARLVLRFVDTIVCADEDILRLGREITDRIDQVAAMIGARQHGATLGELRWTVEYDQACSARQTAIDSLGHVAVVYRESRAA